MMDIKLAFVALSIHLVAGWVASPSKSGTSIDRRRGPRRWRPLRAQGNDNADRYPGGEVVGSTGKIGSYLLHRLNGPLAPLPSTDDGKELRYPQSVHVAAVPRGVAPGCLSPNGAPIYACVPSSSIADVWESTDPARREDLVFLCNCVPSEHLSFALEGGDAGGGITVAVLHFGVSHDIGDDDAQSIPIPQLNTSPAAPPTVIYGKHADPLARLLGEDGIPVHVALHPKEVQAAAARKLAWSSLMWLTCHSLGDGGRPISVKEVHKRHSNELERIVEEVLPSLEALASKPWTRNDIAVENAESNPALSIGSVQDVLDYLEQYSISISGGNVVPSGLLALCEMEERNVLLLRAGDGREQTYHMELIRQVAGDEVLAQCLEDPGEENVQNAHNERIERIKCTSSNLEFLYQSNNADTRHSDAAKSAIVVGAGMMGSSIAYHLSKRGVKVTVMDQRTNLLPSDDDQDGNFDPGAATSSSFAWLNSNDKSPLSYKQFNQIGMEIWRRHDVLKSLPVWCGSLVRMAKPPETEVVTGRPTLKHGPYYTHVGPLSQEEARLLEPGIDWNASGCKNTKDANDGESEVHYYPEEGFVDPYVALRKMRSTASDNGVEFLEGAEIKSLIRDEHDKVGGVEYAKAHDEEAQSMIATADIVVISAGSNSSDPSLGIDSKRLQLLQQPGVLAYARSTSRDNMDHNEPKPLAKIFVDTTAQAHMLRRSDGTLVVGSGQLVTGGGYDNSMSGVSTTSSPQDSADEDTEIGNTMIIRATTSIAPFELQPHPTLLDNGSPQYELVKVTRANRPMPLDGFPVVGFVEQGLYVSVMHSAITMGLLVGELASYEIWHDITAPNDDGRRMPSPGFQILDKYRPSQSRAEA